MFKAFVLTAGLFLLILMNAANVFAQNKESGRARGRGTPNPILRYEITQNCNHRAEERSQYPLYVYLADSEKAKLHDNAFIQKNCDVLLAQVPYVQKIYNFFPVRKKIQLAAMHSAVIFNAGSEPSGELMFVLNIEQPPAAELMAHFMAHEYGHLVLMEIMPIHKPIKEWSNSLVAMHELFADTFVALFEKDITVLPEALFAMGFKRHITQRYFDREIEILEYDPLLAYPHAATQPSRRYLYDNEFFVLQSHVEAIARLNELKDCIYEVHSNIEKLQTDVDHLQLNEQFMQTCTL